MKRTILYTLFFAIMAMCGDKTNASEVIAPPSGEAVMQQKNVQCRLNNQVQQDCANIA